MIELTSSLDIESNPHGGGELVLWMGKPFDYFTPFRRALAEIAEALGPESALSLRLPASAESEDFIEGSLRFNGKLVGVYWEHSLSYLSLQTDDTDALHDIARRIATVVGQLN